MAEEKAQVLGACWQWTRLQRDTYFRTNGGKLKLRQADGEEAELIAYHRPDNPEARLSDYQIYRRADADLLLPLLAATVTVDRVVEKTRILYLWKNIRIHLDRVAHLGSFIEFEAVLRSAQEEAAAPANSLICRWFLMSGLRIWSARDILIFYRHWTNRSIRSPFYCMQMIFISRRNTWL